MLCESPEDASTPQGRRSIPANSMRDEQARLTASSQLCQRGRGALVMEGAPPAVAAGRRQGRCRQVRRYLAPRLACRWACGRSWVLRGAEQRLVDASPGAGSSAPTQRTGLRRRVRPAGASLLPRRSRRISGRPRPPRVIQRAAGRACTSWEPWQATATFRLVQTRVPPLEAAEQPLLRGRKPSGATTRIRGSCPRPRSRGAVWCEVATAARPRRPGSIEDRERFI